MKRRLCDIPVEELETHPQWHYCSDRQKEFLRKFLRSNGEKEASVEGSYDVCSNKSARALASILLRKPHIKQILYDVCGYETKRIRVTRTELLALISARLRENPGIREFNQLSGIYADLRGWREVPLGRKGTRKALAREEAGEAEPRSKDDLMNLVLRYEKEQRNEEDES